MNDSSKVPAQTVAAIEHAVSQLEAQGTRPTARLVRKVVGRRMEGCNRELRKLLKERAAASQVKFEAPEELKSTFERGYQALVVACDRFVQDRLSILESSATARVAEAEVDADDAIEAEEEAQRERDHLADLLKDANERIALMERDLASRRTELQEKNRQIQDLKEILQADRRESVPTKRRSSK